MVIQWNKLAYDRGGGNVGTISVSVNFHGPIFQTENVEKAIARATKDTLIYGKRVIKEKTPVDTGLLKSQWFYRTGQRKIFNEVYYSIFVEAGTRFMSPRAMAQKSAPAIGQRYEVNLSSAVSDFLT